MIMFVKSLLYSWYASIHACDLANKIVRYENVVCDTIKGMIFR